MEGTYAFHGYCLFAIGHVNRNYRNNSLRQFMIFFSYRFYTPSCGRENTGIVKHKSRQAKLRIEYQIAELGTRYFFPGSLIANSLFLDHGSLSLNR